MHYKITKVGQKKNAPNIYLEGKSLLLASFSPGQRYDVNIDEDKVELKINEHGARLTSKKSSKGREWPVIDLNSEKTLSMFRDYEAVRVVIEPGSICLLPLSSEMKKKERFERMRDKLQNNESLTSGGLSFGLGLLSYALHTAFKKAGYGVDLKFCNEIRDDLMEQALERNPVLAHTHAKSNALQAMAVCAPMQEIIQDEFLMSRVPKVDILEAGIPCSGASRAMQNKLEMMEDHPHVGHLAHAFLALVDKLQPAVLLLENVPEYRKTASMQIIRRQLTDMGYQITEAIVNARDHGSLESRNRLFMIASTAGIEINFDQISPRPHVLRPLSDFLEDIPLDSELWGDRKYLDVKRERDIEKNNGFKRSFLDEDSIHIHTLRKGYHKGGSPDPQLRHPKEPQKTRLLRGSEHARVKGFDEEGLGIFDGMSNTGIHEALGQAVCRHSVDYVAQVITNGLDKLKAILEKNPNLSLRDLETYRKSVSRADASLVEFEEKLKASEEAGGPFIASGLSEKVAYSEQLDLFSALSGASSLIEKAGNTKEIEKDVALAKSLLLTAPELNDEPKKERGAYGIAIPVKGKRGYSVG